jgi:hypothetical protein
VSPNIIDKIFQMQLKVTYHFKSQENHNLNIQFPQHHLLRRLSFCGAFVGNQMAVAMWAYFWIFYLISSTGQENIIVIMCINHRPGLYIYIYGNADRAGGRHRQICNYIWGLQYSLLETDRSKNRYRNRF